MKLSQIHEGYWTLAPGSYPNSLIKNIKKSKDTKEGKPKRHSMLVHPNDRERFVKWGFDN